MRPPARKVALAVVTGGGIGPARMRAPVPSPQRSHMGVVMTARGFRRTEPHLAQLRSALCPRLYADGAIEDVNRRDVSCEGDRMAWGSPRLSRFLSGTAATAHPLLVPLAPRAVRLASCDAPAEGVVETDLAGRVS